MHKQFPVPLEQQQHVHQSIKNEPINSQESVQSAAACYQQQQEEDKDDQQQKLVELTGRDSDSEQEPQMAPGGISSSIFKEP